jgi:hypothetical protein
MPQYKVNDSVRYKPVGGTSLSLPRILPVMSSKAKHANGYIVIGPQSHTSETVGVIKDVLTSPGNLTGRQVQASAEDPRYEVAPQSPPKT